MPNQPPYRPPYTPGTVSEQVAGKIITPDHPVLVDGYELEPQPDDYTWTKPSKQWLHLPEEVQQRVLQQLNKLGFQNIQENWQDLEAYFDNRDNIQSDHAFNPQYNNVLVRLSQDPELLSYATRFFPRLYFIYDKWQKYMQKVADAQREDAATGGDDASKKQTMEQYLELFSNGKSGKFVWAGDFIDTQSKVAEWLSKHERDETPPPLTLPYQIRIGGSRFFVPPINIQVNQSYRAGSMTGGAIRQQNSPKFNTGHTDTTISLTLYFPNQESIWGYPGLDDDINFDTDSDEKIDRFISSLRGLIAQFKYSPILPVRNEYLNRTYDITAVALQSLSVQTMPNYPFCLAVNLELLSFNHKVYLPMLNDFNQAIKWGRFRQYMGRAADKLNSYVNQGFLIEKPNEDPKAPRDSKILDSTGSTKSAFSKLADLDIADLNGNPNKFDIYYPSNTPVKVYAPDTYGWLQPGENQQLEVSRDLWAQLLGTLGYDVLAHPEALYDYLDHFDQRTATNVPGGIGEFDILVEYLNQQGLALTNMSEDKLNEYLAARIEQKRKQLGSGYNDKMEEADTKLIKELWFYYMFKGHLSSPLFKQYMDQENSKRQFQIAEWNVPMTKLNLDWSKVIVQGVSVSLGNNFARLQLQMQAEPTLQHIGGKDAVVSVNMIVLGEDDLIKLRRAFDHINGLARLEHSHGMLGFLGIKNVITTLCGVKYVVPLNFSIDTIPNQPHAYNVRLDMVDFDIFQQKREELSNGQQKEFIEMFGKRNPFLRVKQLWSSFNAYPDFPLGIYEDVHWWEFSKKRRLIGHLDPDFYFKSFETFDDSLVQQNLRSRPSQAWRNTVYDPNTKKVEDSPTKNTDEQRQEDFEKAKKIIWPSAVDDQLSKQQNNPDGTTTPGIDPNIADQAYGAAQIQMNVYFPAFGDGETKMSAIAIKQGDVALANVNMSTGELDLLSADPANPAGGFGSVREDHAGQSLNKSLGAANGGDSVTTAFSDYGQPTAQKPGESLGRNDPMYQVQQMIEDTQYRNRSGRMVRAFPTYMLWLIDEGGNFAGAKLFDNFYGLQSVIDFSVHSSEDVLGDVLTLRLSNMYSKLDNPQSRMVRVNDDGTSVDLGPSLADVINQDPNSIDEALDKQILTKLDQGVDNLLSGTQNNYIRDLAGIRLKPGVRVHLRAGYSANPNSLQTIFNGTITQVTQGDIVEVTAQGDGIELSPYVNSTDKDGDSGHIDGGLNTGLWLSEPRDLMVRLLSMGSSTFRESFANAFNGRIFSENKFGIRHFGQILYEEMTSGEASRVSYVTEAVKSAHPSMNGQTDPFTESKNGAFDNLVGNDANVRSGVSAIMMQLWANSFRHRDYEIFKRNIYPGNGTGIAQYLGGDFPEAGIMIAEAAGADGGQAPIFASPEVKRKADIERAKRGQGNNQDTQKDEQKKEDQPQDGGMSFKDAMVFGATWGTSGIIQSGWDLFNRVLDGDLNDNPLFNALGIVSGLDDDLKGFDEVSFRAQTYMKSVWDLFQVCAALLPNYVVAVRPFEDRSTVFYGKPHWLYTSGVIPVTTGIPKDDTSVKVISPDEEQRKLLEKLRNMSNPLADFQSQQKLFSALNEVTAVNPAATNAGLAYTGEDVEGLPQFLDGEGKPTSDESKSKVKLPVRQGKTVMEMHLPTDPDIQADTSKHLQSSTLPDQYKHPGYMDREGGPRGGDPGYDPHKEDQNTRGQHGAFMYFNQPGFGPEEEQWYFNMRWPFTDSWNEPGNPQMPGHSPADYRGKRVAIKSKKTGKVVIAAIGDSGPYLAGGCAAGMSPDCWYALGLDGVGSGTDDSICFFGFVNQSTKLGPTDGSGVSTGTGTSSTSDKQNPSGDVNVANIIASTAATGYANALSPGADPKSFWAYNKGYLSTNYNVWGVVDNYDDEKNDVETVKNAATVDPVGHYARLLYDREYAKRIYSFVKKGELGKEVLLGSEDLQFGSAFSDLGQLDKKEDPNNPQENNDVNPGDVLRLAEHIWDQFREKWGVSKEDKYGVVSEIRNSAWKKYRDYIFDPDPTKLQKVIHNDDDDDSYDPLTDNAGRYTLEEDAYWSAAQKNPPGARVDIWTDGSIDNYDPATADDNYDYLPTLLVGMFKKFMWQHPYARAWLVVTTDFNTSVLPSDSWMSSGVEFVTGNWFGQQVGATAIIAGGMAVGGPFAAPLMLMPPGKMRDFLGSANADELCDFANSRVREAWKKFLTITARDAFEGNPPPPLGGEGVKGPINDWTKKWDRGQNGELSESANEFLKFLQDNASPGKKSQNPWARVMEDLSVKYDNTIGRLLSVSANSLQGLISLFRGQLTQLGYGLDMVGNMQRQARVLNRVLNDSIYYAEGSYLPDGRPDLLKMVDNPFTREYGEPVIEIREPFQRLHYIDSFQHILRNSIQENLNGVSTVITASSDGKYPVTVYFDKGIQSNLQNEQGVETGIFWDNANGEGFFSFLHPLMHPIESLRGFSKAAQGSSDELLSKRIALWHLKENLKDIYQGEIFVLGDPDIRAHDLLYIADVYERIYGLVEVEAVTHHFTPEDGFITAITPNALVTINDPARWAFTKWITAIFGAKNIRDDTRHHMGVFADDTSILRSRDWITTADLAEMLSVPMLGHTVYDGGASAIVKDFVAAKATGLYQTETDRMKLLDEVKSRGEAQDQQTGGLPTVGAYSPNNPNAPELYADVLGNIPGIGLVKDLTWDIWGWVKDNLLDQHGCYIQYLTKDGQPMDAGLSYAQGVAVGRFHTVELLPNILGITASVDGRITVNELLASLGWNEVDIALAYKQTSWWVAQTQSNILDVAGLSPDGSSLLDEQFLVSLVEVTKIEDGDTFHGRVIGGDQAPQSGDSIELSFRLAGVRAPELSNHKNPEYVPEDDIGRRARQYLESLIPVGTTVVVRQAKSRSQEFWGRQLAVVFHNAPNVPKVWGVYSGENTRDKILMAQAGRIPDGNGGWKPSPVTAAAWDGYLDNGLPYTVNWQMIMAGYADVDATKLTQNDLDRGAIMGPK